MKSVLISIKPKWCELIASGKKTIEVRKTRPKIETPFKCYIYCTHGDPTIYISGNKYVTDDVSILSPKAQEAFERVSGFAKMNGKVIGEFVCDRVITAQLLMDGGFNPEWSDDEDCITEQEFDDYSSNARTLYGWHISDLLFYDYPRELSCFCKPCCFEESERCDNCKELQKIFNCRLKRPPQSWCYVEEMEKEQCS